MLDRLFRFLFGVGWRDEVPSAGMLEASANLTAAVNSALANLLAPCLRDKSDPKWKRHYFGRGGEG